MINEITKLVNFAEHTAELLAKYKEMDWAVRLQNDIAKIRSGDIYGVVHLRHAFAGMSNLSELVIHPSNGHPIRLEEVLDVNERLNSLRAQIRDLVEKIAHEIDPLSGDTAK